MRPCCFPCLSEGTPRVWTELPLSRQQGPAPFQTRAAWILVRLLPQVRRCLTTRGSPDPPLRFPFHTKRGAQQYPSPNPSAPLDGHSQLCDHRLKHIKIHNWTQVPITNELAARLISFYLTVDHPILGLFDADLFLGDLVAHKTDFCCPLLLTAVLCFACVCRQDTLFTLMCPEFHPRKKIRRR